jgi:hypothetical protein
LPGYASLAAHEETFVAGHPAGIAHQVISPG